MNRVRISVLPVLAVLAFSGIAASSAAAAEYRSGTGTGYTGLTAINEGTWTFQGGSKVTCSTVTADGSFLGSSTSFLTMTGVAFSGCKVAGQTATLNMNGCDFQFFPPTGSASPYSVVTSIQCPSGKEIVITATTAGCTIKIPAQLMGGSSTVTNVGGFPGKIVFALAESGIDYTGSGGVCGGSGFFGTLQGKWLVQAYSDAAHTKQVGIQVF